METPEPPAEERADRIDVTQATPKRLNDLLDRVNQATRLLQRSKTVPHEIGELVDSFDGELNASAPQRLEINPYLAQTMWAGLYGAEKALRHDNQEQQRREVRLALEQVRHALRDIVESRPYDDGTPTRDVLNRTFKAVGVPQKAFADLIGTSPRQLQRWLADESEPGAEDAAHILAVGRVVNQLRHSFTGPGVVAWLKREHPRLKDRPIDLLAKDPLRLPEVLAEATASRAMAG